MITRTLCSVLPALAFLLGTLLAQHHPVPSVLASPADVRGSDNVLVTGYRNRAGTFLLWSSGRITRPDGSLANAAGNYVTAPGYVKPPTVQNQTVGSGNVACGVAPGADGTVVLFSDGTGRRPVNPEAAASCLEVRVVWGCVNVGPSYGYGSGDWSVDPSTPGPPYRVSFHPAFQGAPAVVTTGLRGAHGLINITRNGFDAYDLIITAPMHNIPFSFVAVGQ